MEINRMEILPNYLTNKQNTCEFCHITMGYSKEQILNFGWYCCSNNKCLEEYEKVSENYLKKNNLFTYNLFEKIINNNKLNVPEFFTIDRSDSSIDHNWQFEKKISNGYFLYWYQGKWVILMTKIINNQNFIKYINFNSLGKYNNINTKLILNLIQTI